MRPLSNAGRLPAQLPTAASSLVPAPHQSWPGALVGKPRGETGGRSCRKNARKKATVRFCFERKDKQGRKHLVYLIMLLIFIMERQGTLLALANPAQTKITQTPASFFIFAFSALRGAGS